MKDAPVGEGPVVYWMSRDQRVRNNWALVHSQQIALRLRRPLGVVFCLVPEFMGATIRHYGFMLRGLSEVEENLAAKNIGFSLLRGNPEEEVSRFIRKHGAAILVTDFDPLRIKRQWKRDVKKRLSIPFHEVDAHNIVPCWIASDKQEYAARTFRPKTTRALSEYLEEFPAIKAHPFKWPWKLEPTDWNKVIIGLKVDRSVGEVDWMEPGEKGARKALKRFVSHKLLRYDDDRNDPNADGQSDFSPYLHFGQISAQRVALAVKESKAKESQKEAFLEELIVRRELSDNYCFYNTGYDNYDSFPDWARATLEKHRKDRREYLYDINTLERGATHDPLWNAAQMQMVRRGKMHGYMRMYWAKKILEWTTAPQEALKAAIYLNDRYELDGRDPNGYTGVAWSIGGVHDRPWPERPIFGKIRYMSYGGCKSKFNVAQYIGKTQED
jgi:deoxyribodipyrimidine photo-lyase